MPLEKLIPYDCWAFLTRLQWFHANETHHALVALPLGTIIITGILLKYGKAMLVKKRLSAKRAEKRKECAKARSQWESDVSSQMTTQHNKLVELTLQELITKLQSGEVKPTDALLAYQSKAIEKNKILNCVIEPIKEAKELASSLEQHEGEKQKGPLYGIPVSIKDNFGIKGYDSTIGCAKRIGQPCTEDAVVVQLLKLQGAVPFVKTNIPQTMLSWETTNPIFGVTRNPHDTSRGVGGSSGGEGSLIAGGGSILGFGSDIGGSIRIPANMCGICGLKPTELRVSNKGTAPLQPGQTTMNASYGPLARDVESLVIGLKALCIPEMSILDPVVPYMPFDDEIYNSKKKLKIGYFVDDAFFCAVPAMQRGVWQTVAALEKLGYEVVPWKFDDLGFTAVYLWANIMMGDGGECITKLLEGDATDGAMKTVVSMSYLPEIVTKCLASVLKYIYPSMAMFMRSSIGMKTVSNWWKLNSKCDNFRGAVAADWRAKGLDAVICPGFGCPALPINKSGFATGASSYTMLYNVLNFPAGSLPVTKVTKQDNDKLKDYPIRDLWHKVVKQSMSGSEGLPINVQVAALPYKEELVLRIMKDIESVMKL